MTPRNSLRLPFGLGALLLCAWQFPAHAADIRVPADQPTIQAGIDAAVDGDVVIVADGTYTGDGNKNLDFGGRAVTVRSQNNDPAKCVIDCQGSGRGFSFHSGETASSVVQGFTVRNGNVGTWYAGTDTQGGAILCWGSSPTINNCVLRDNLAYTGGGLRLQSSSAVVTNCAFIGNRAVILGGGMGESHSAAAITNCAFIGNSSGSSGGGLSTDQDNPTVTNCTFFGNTADFQGGGINTYVSNPVVTNCILWGNSAKFGNQIGGNSWATVSHSDVQGGYPGTNVFSADPRFADAASGDFHLRADSLCINRGDSAAVTSPPFLRDGRGDIGDLGGNPRVVGKAVDLGVYESPILSRPPVAVAGPGQTLGVPHDGNPAATPVPFTLDGSASYDPDGGGIVSHYWSDGAGHTATVAKPTFTLPAGTYTFTLTVRNSDDERATDAVTVTISAEPNRAPVANGQSLSLDSGNSKGLTLSASDGDGDTLSYEVVSPPANGTLSGTAPNLTYAPDAPDFAGTDGFTFKVTDPYGASGTATVDVTVNDKTPPVVTAPGDATATTATATSTAGAAVTFNVTATDNVDGAVAVSCTPPSGSTFAPGRTTVSCAATDKAGNRVSKAFVVWVQYAWGGFLPPLPKQGVNRGSTIPVKFALTGASAGITNLSARLYVTAPGAAAEALLGTFKYDRASGQYQYNWNTGKGLSAGAYTLRADLGDGVTDRTVGVQLTK